MYDFDPVILECVLEFYAHSPKAPSDLRAEQHQCLVRLLHYYPVLHKKIGHENRGEIAVLDKQKQLADAYIDRSAYAF